MPRPIPTPAPTALLAAVLVPFFLCVVSGCGDAGAAAVAQTPQLDVTQIHERLDARRGEPMLVNFWATWCGPCLEELDELQQAGEKLRELGGDLIGISVDPVGPGYDAEKFPERLPRWLKRRELTFTVWLHPESDANALFTSFELPRRRRVPGTIPWTIAIDRDGAVVDLHEGPASAERLQEMIDRAAGE